MAAVTLLGGGAGSVGWVWDYQCDCGLDYRVRSVDGGATFWPRVGRSGFSQHSLAAGQDCLKCAKPLSLNQCSIDVPDATFYGS
jgi:hypothetical protein